MSALRHVDHCCAVCETTCAEVTALRRRVRDLQDAILLVSVVARDARELRDFARDEIDARFPLEERRVA